MSDRSLADRSAAARGAEAALLGSMMRHPDAVPEVRDQVREDDFHHDAHRRVFAAVVRLAERSAPIDLVSVAGELRHAGQEADTGHQLLAELWDVGGANVGRYAEVVLSLALERGLSLATAQTEAELEQPVGPPAELLERAQARLDRLAARVAGTAAIPIGETVNETIELIDARMSGRKTAGPPTGFPGLDVALSGGLPVGQLLILGARPSVGKTSFSINLAANVCRAGGSVLFVSLEQPRVELMERLLALEARVPGGKIRTGQLSQEDAAKLSAAADVLRPWRWQTNDDAVQTAQQIAAGARRAKRKAGGLDLIVVDYLNLVAPENPRASRNEQTGTSARRLREMGRELGVPVLLLCQLSRAAEESDVPRLHHLRDSGEIEQHADVVLFLHRSAAREYGKPDQIELHLAKQRNGPLDMVAFEHECWFFRFAERSALPE